jgi:ribosomal protein L4
LNINGTQLDSSNELKLNVLEASGNYLLHKDILRHFNSQRQTVSTKLVAKFEVVVVNHGVKSTGRARAGSNSSPLWKVVNFGPKTKKGILKLNKKERRLALQTLLYNKKKNILIIENLENEITEPKTKAFKGL